MADHQRGGCGLLKWRRAAEHFEDDASEAVDIASRIDLGGEDLLGRHVARRSNNSPVAGELNVVLAADDFCDTEVEYFDEIFVAVDINEENVVGFDVAMNDSVTVCFAQGATDLGGDVDGAGGFQRSLFDEIAERVA